MDSYLWIKYVHELAAIWFIAGILGRQLVRTLARQSGDIHHFAMLTQAAGRFESLMVIPGNMLVIVFGLVAAWRGGWPILGFLQGADTNWLLLTMVILVALMLLVPLVFLPRGRKFDPLLQEAIAQGEMTASLITVLDDPVVKWAHRAEAAGILVIMALMVFKPF